MPSSVHSTGTPAPVRRAFVLWMAVLVLNVVAVLLGLFLTPTTVQGVDPGTAVPGSASERPSSCSSC